MNESAAISRNSESAKEEPAWFSAAGVKWRLADPALQSELNDFLAEPERFFRAQEPGLPKGQGATSVARMGRFFVKRYNHQQDSVSKKLKNIVRIAPALNAFHVGLRLIEDGIPTARPVAVGEERVGGVLKRGFLVTEFLDRARPLVEEPTSLLTRSRQAGRLIAALHNNGFVHGDLNLTNLVFTGPGELCLVDLDTAKEIGRVSETDSWHELSRFLVNALRSKSVPLACRAAFLQEYCRARGFDEWGKWWNEIGRLYDAESRRLKGKARSKS